MRYLYKRKSNKWSDAEAGEVEEAMTSPAFIFIDLFFIAGMLSMMAFPTLSSLILRLALFAAIYFLGAMVYVLLRYWLKDSEDSGFIKN